ncbi:MAG TPA: tetratricopeptide repeat protein [Burkholderiaceae bacterium]|nr:tetratricopeptide repeat protein [Burkholderiaceae bacterium]
MNITFSTPHPAAASRWRYTTGRILAISGLLATLFAGPAAADEPADVSRLLKAGQLGDAITKADAFLAQHPRDAQMRFLKGVILTEQNKSAEAIGVFTKMTEDFPDLPEPYNNLAVLYANVGQYDKARLALDAAIRTNPAYATAYENLGDVHAKLASQAYDKALQIDSGNATAKSKLTLLRSLMVAGSVAPKGATVATRAPAASVAVVAQAPKPAVSAAAPAAPRAAPAPVPTAPARPPVAVPAPVAPVALAKPVDKSDAERVEVLHVVNGWAKAWSARDVKGYLGFYASDFETPHGESRKAWMDERQARIAGKGRISVGVDSPQVSISGNTATVKFRQNYVSDRLKANSRKTLVLVRQGSKWQIRQERTGS